MQKTSLPPPSHYNYAAEDDDGAHPEHFQRSSSVSGNEGTHSRRPTAGGPQEVSVYNYMFVVGPVV